MTPLAPGPAGVSAASSASNWAMRARRCIEARRARFREGPSAGVAFRVATLPLTPGMLLGACVTVECCEDEVRLVEHVPRGADATPRQEQPSTPR